MKRYRFNYQSIIRFDTPVTRHCFKLRCLPVSQGFQKVLDEKLYLRPKIVLNQGADAFGNRIQYGHTLEAHDAFIFSSNGEVEQQPYCIPETEIHPMYCFESCLTGLSNALISFSQSLPLNQDTSVEQRAMVIAHAVYSYMDYRPMSTNNSTTASQAFSQAQGVCQDYTHIFLALCRLNHIPARYVNGFMQGIGFTHAWAEVYDGTKWIGIDPTNDTHIEYGYIKVAHGRDATSCPVNRGIFLGTARQYSEVRVLVEEISDF